MHPKSPLHYTTPHVQCISPVQQKTSLVPSLIVLMRRKITIDLTIFCKNTFLKIVFRRDKMLYDFLSGLDTARQIVILVL